MGVADGVYMWREQGIDAGLFSRGLMDAAAAATSRGCVSPLSMMHKAYKARTPQAPLLPRPCTTTATEQNMVRLCNPVRELSRFSLLPIPPPPQATLGQGLQGSATICLVVLDALHGVINSANIGDSGYLLMRPPSGPGEKAVVKYRSPHQEHEFGRPYQLGHHANSDRPENAMRVEHDLHAGDVIVLGTDGAPLS